MVSKPICGATLAGHHPPLQSSCLHTPPPPAPNSATNLSFAEVLLRTDIPAVTLAVGGVLEMYFKCLCLLTYLLFFWMFFKKRN